jgi:predicted Rossmann-fold nucleotide-binding protein
MLDGGLISKEDMDSFKVMDDPQEIVDYIKKFVIL